MNQNSSNGIGHDVNRCSTGKITVGPLTIDNIKFEGPDAAHEFRRTLRELFDQAHKKGYTAPPPSNPSDAETEVGPLSIEIEKFITGMHLDRDTPQNITTTHHTLKLLLGIIGDKRIADINQDDIHAFKEGIRWWPAKANLKAAYRGLSVKQIIDHGRSLSLDEPSGHTVNNHMAKLNKFFSKLVRQRKLKYSPLSGITLRVNGHVGPIEERYYSEAELGRIFDAKAYMSWAKGRPHCYWPPLLSYYTGARINEIAQLKLSDFETVRGVLCIQIRVSKDIGEDGLPLDTVNQKLKTKSSARTIPVSPELIALGLKNYLEDVRLTGHPRLFPHLSAGISVKNGRRQVLGYSHSLTPAFSRYLKVKGFPSGVVFHAFRHTFVSLLYEQGATIEQIESITGHLDSPGNRGGGTLHRHYLHKKATESIQDALETLKMLRPLEGVPAYDSKLFAASLGEKRKFHP
ncbi:site-specific integrase [Paracidovorax citrulli]